MGRSWQMTESVPSRSHVAKAIVEAPIFDLHAPLSDEGMVMGRLETYVG